MIKTIIVDDEPAILEEMKNLLESDNRLSVVGAYTEPLKALDEAKNIKPDYAFLDINMIGMNGIELAKRLILIHPKIDIVFVTACNNYAAQAFDLNAADYILKPVSKERLQKAIKKLMRKRIDNCQYDNKICTIRSFGNFEVLIGDQIIKWNRSKTKELFAYLLQWQGKSISKYKLCEVLWPELPHEQALPYLQTSIWTIRKKFKEIGFEVVKIEYTDGKYFIKIDQVKWDVLDLERHYQIFLESGNKDALKRALEYYQGEYMEGEGWLWAYADREKYRKQYKVLLSKC